MAYTRFPRLLAQELGQEQLQVSELFFELECSADDLLKAWGRLLSAYSGSDGEVSFRVDDDDVKIKLVDGEITRQARVDPRKRKTQVDDLIGASGVFFHDVS